MDILPLLSSFSAAMAEYKNRIVKIWLFMVDIIITVNICQFVFAGILFEISSGQLLYGPPDHPSPIGFPV